MSKMGQWIIEQIEAGNVAYDDRREDHIDVKINQSLQNRKGRTATDPVKHPSASTGRHGGGRQFLGVSDIRDRQVNRKTETE
jgi:hypothetical protein